MRIIPAIDLIEGKCVRLSQGDYNNKKIYNEDPLEVAKSFEDNGIQYLHLVDLEGAKSLHIKQLSVLEKIATKTNLKIDFGGGIKTAALAKNAFDAGAVQISIGSAAHTDPSMFYELIEQYGQDKIILGADCLDNKLAINGWKNNTETNIIDALVSFENKNGKYCICTDIAKDGMLAGPSFELYQQIIQETQLHLIASGGITSIADLMQLKEMNCEGAIIGKAIYEGQITLKSLQTLC